MQKQSKINIGKGDNSMAIELFEMQTKISDALLRLEQLGESL